ncbi:MAG: VOC family protein [Planctomycetes bacterium]|nr:VOC family protein [Planctomycetota bacterium]
MIDHIGMSVEKYDECKEFYKKALAPLGITLVKEIPKYFASGFGKNGKPEFWFGKGEKNTPRMHVAFKAESREQVDAFYKAAVEAGGKDNGKPGVREIYHPNYYGAFVLDPDGNNAEAVFHGA